MTIKPVFTSGEISLMSAKLNQIADYTDDRSAAPILPEVAPVDADIPEGEARVWLDTATSKLKTRGRLQNGTLYSLPDQDVTLDV